MKILKIEFQNINSLKGSHQVDFSAAPFTASSLFAITGPTGSGKSTLLDVISLALFNQVPRLGKITRNEIRNKGALLTRNQKEAYAKVTYQSKSGTYTSQWNISTNRNDKLRDYDMELFDLSTGKAIDLKKSDVPGKNEAIIGLSYDQFIKSVLLAQGEFAQFLKARKDERGALLEKITGTGIYRLLGIQAFQKKKEVGAAIEKEEQEIALLKGQLLEEEERKQFKGEAEERSQQRDVLEKKVKFLEGNLQLKSEIREQRKAIDSSDQNKKTAEQALLEFNREHGKELQDHENIQKFGAELRHWQQLRSVREELLQECDSIEQRTRANRDQADGCLEEIRTFLKDEGVQAASLEKALQNFSTRVMQLQRKRDEKISTYRTLQREFNTELREVPYELNGKLQEARAELETLQARLEQEIGALKPHLSDLNLADPGSEKIRLRQALEKARKAEQAEQKLFQVVQELQHIQSEKKEILPELQELPQKIKLEQSEGARLKERLQKLQLERENIQLRKSLEAHRQHLEDGSPCPLCGSLDHPYATDLPAQQDGLQEEIRSLEKHLEQKNQAFSSLQTRLEYHQGRLKKLREKEEQLSGQLERERNTFRERFGVDFSDQKDRWSQQVAQLDKQIQSLEAFEQKNRRLQAIGTGLPLVAELDKVTAEGKEIKAQLELLYSGSDVHSDCLDLQNRWNGFQHEKKNLDSRLEELKEKIRQRKDQVLELEKELLPAIEKEGCSQLPEALARLLPEQKAAEYRKKKEALCATIARHEASLKTLQGQLKKLQENDGPEPEDQLQEMLRENREKLKGILALSQEIHRKLLNDQETRERIAKIEAGLEERRKHTRRWELLNQLIGDASGKKFNDFAQDLSLTQLLKLANLRLKDLSDRYLLDKPGEDEDDSLVAIDEHMGGQRRSVKTLSGGETFILSLSMALALSDLASKNVEINSLFIDEGFGTLDPETLDQTLDTLEKLQAETSKTIGIISHVDSLKERIATQIRLERNGQGYSSLSVSG